MKIDRDAAELLFRVLFCLIFIGLGGEHIVSDHLLQKLMPEWMPWKRFVSVACGMWLIIWGTFILIGWRLQWAAFCLGSFVIVVTVLVHVPGVLETPNIPREYSWMWVVLQRSNLVKNVCLLGVCFHLFYHEPGKYSFERYLERRSG